VRAPGRLVQVIFQSSVGHPVFGGDLRAWNRPSLGLGNGYRPKCGSAG
jgi:hypothetical protein